MNSSRKVSALLLFVVVVCGCSNEAPTLRPEGGTGSELVDAEGSTVEEVLVAERRPLSDAEYNRIDDDDLEGTVLDCNEYGFGVWDYGPITADSPKQSADQALLRAIDEIESDWVKAGFEPLPKSGWSQFSRGEGTFYYVHDSNNWQTLISVGGNPELGVFRHQSFYSCPP